MTAHRCELPTDALTGERVNSDGTSEMGGRGFRDSRFRRLSCLGHKNQPIMWVSGPGS